MSLPPFNNQNKNKNDKPSKSDHDEEEDEDEDYDYCEFPDVDFDTSSESSNVSSFRPWKPKSDISGTTQTTSNYNRGRGRGYRQSGSRYYRGNYNPLDRGSVFSIEHGGSSTEQNVRGRGIFSRGRGRFISPSNTTPSPTTSSRGNINYNIRNVRTTSTTSTTTTTTTSSTTPKNKGKESQKRINPNNNNNKEFIKSLSNALLPPIDKLTNLDKMNITNNNNNSDNINNHNQIMIDKREVSSLKDERYFDLPKPTNSQLEGIISEKSQILTNYFTLSFDSNIKSIYKYSIKSKPKINPKHLYRFEILESLVNENPQIFKYKAFKYDGDFISMYSQNLFSNFTTTIKGIEITITFQNEISTDFSNYKNRKNFEAITFLNILTKSFFPTLGFTRLGRHYYSKIINPIVEFKVDIYNGYISTVHLIDKGVAMLLDITSRAIRSNSVLDILKELEMSHEKCEKELLGKVVFTKYNNRYYRINRIAWDKSIFDQMDSTTTTTTTTTTASTRSTITTPPITFKEYYEKNYSFTPISDMNQPLLEIIVSRNSKKVLIYLIPELCIQTGRPQLLNSQDDIKLSTEIDSRTMIHPKDRFEILSQFTKNLHLDSNISSQLDNWGVRIGEPIKVDAVQYKVEIITNSNQDYLSMVVWSLIGEKSEIENNQKNIDQLVNDYCHLPTPYSVIKVPDGSNSDEYLSIFKQEIEKPNCGIELFIIILPEKDHSIIYKGIKNLSLLREPAIITQCIKSSKLKDRLNLISKPIASQIIAKMGKYPWSIDPKSFSNIPENTMVVGIDVTHNPEISYSVAAFVASINNTHSQYHHKINIQPFLKEILDSNFIAIAIKESMNSYRDLHPNKKYPELVIVYRDGVADGMLKMVKDHEVNFIKSSIDSLVGSGLTKLMYVIVKKNSNTRFLNLSDNNNPPHGTLVNCGITNPFWYDFYLVSQNTSKKSKSSVKPTNYHIIHNDANIPVDSFQYFTFQMSNLFFNISNSVRTPAPCNYAHNLAYFIGKYFQTTKVVTTTTTTSTTNTATIDNNPLVPFDENLYNKLYFL